MGREIRFALRSLRRSPTFTISVVATLGLAMGLATAIVSVIATVLLDPMPGVDLSRVVSIESSNAKERLHHLGLDPWSVFQLERRKDLFAGVAGYRVVSANRSDGSSTTPISIASTTGEFFNVFDVKPVLGRVYDTVEVNHGSRNVVLLGFNFWRTSMGSARDIVGSHVVIDDSTYTVIGVLPRSFRFPAGADVWTPKPFDPLLDPRLAADGPRAGLLLPTVARLQSSTTREVTDRQLSMASAEWKRQFPSFFAVVGDPSVTVRSAIDLLAGPLRPIVLLLSGAVAMVLLTACTNVASLQLVRTTGKMREMALHAALGSTPGTLLRYQAIESLLLAAAGGVVGIGIGYLLILAARHVAAAQLADLQALRLNVAVLVAAGGLMTLSALVFGCVPALRAFRVTAGDVLRATASRTSTVGMSRSAFLRGTVVAQVSLAVALMLSAEAAVLSLRNVLNVDPGFQPEGLITARITLPRSRYAKLNIAALQRRLAFHSELLDQLRSVEGFVSATTADGLPFGFSNEIAAATHRRAVTSQIGLAASGDVVPANAWNVDGSFFKTMNIAFTAGQPFSDAEIAQRLNDYQTAALPVVIDELLANRLFPNQSPIGRIIGPAAPGFTVVGVVRPMRQSDLAMDVDHSGTIYLPTVPFLDQMTIIVRSRLPLGPSAELLRRSVANVDSRLALFDVVPMTEVIDRSVEARRLASAVLGFFGILTLFLSSMGIYGVVSYVTAQRTPEIGIRIALGATPGAILRMVFRDGMTIVMIGAVAGVIVFLGLAQFLAALVYGITPRSPTLILGGLLVVIGVAVVAVVVPARRAAGVDPLQALGAS